MKLIVLLLIIFSAVQTHAFSDLEFCQELVKQNKSSGDRIPFKHMTTLLFNPKKIIQAEQIFDEQSTELNSEEHRKIVYVHLPEVTYDKDLLKKLRQSEKRIIKLKLYKKLRKVSDENVCLELIMLDQESFSELRKHIDMAVSLEGEVRKRKDYFGVKELKSKLKSFKRSGWEIVFSPNIIHFLKDIGLKKPKEIVFVAHSDENGRLYDAEKNILPNKTFNHLSQFVQHFILFSCNAQKVIQHYELEKIMKNKTLTFPEIKDDFKKIFNQKTPLISIKAVIDLPVFTQNELTRTELCKVKIKSAVREQNLIVTLNDQVIGGIHEEEEKTFEVDCLVIREANIIKLFQPTSAPKIKLNILEMTIFKNSQETNLTIKEFISQTNQHHILTIGTNGGIP